IKVREILGLGDRIAQRAPRNARTWMVWPAGAAHGKGKTRETLAWMRQHSRFTITLDGRMKLAVIRRKGPIAPALRLGLLRDALRLRPDNPHLLAQQAEIDERRARRRAPQADDAPTAATPAATAPAAPETAAAEANP
ncbi:MAG: hypothetical protein AAF772_18105, partial [Acidobacteriota bacterium]